MEKIRCVLYARYSSDNQREVSAEEQIKHCKEYAERMEFEVVGEYIDKAMTGTNANRKNFLRMIEDSKSRTFRYVIVYANNRFARNRYDKQYYKRELQKNGVDILYSTQEILNGNSPDSILYESLDDGISEWYSRNLAVEVMKKRLCERINELATKYNREGQNFLLEELEKIGFEIQGGKAMVYLDEEGNAVSLARVRKESDLIGAQS